MPTSDSSTESISFEPLTIQQVNWHDCHSDLTHIRHSVFVHEQHVPVEEELDDKDPREDTRHWLIQDQDQNPIATARMLPDGKVGRVAVMKAWRGKNIGNLIMGAIIRYACTQTSLDKLYLGSQVSAIPFYEKLGFVAEGDQFLDAGIPHRNMTLALARYRDTDNTRASSPVPEIEREQHTLQGDEDMTWGAITLLKSAKRLVRIYSEGFEGGWLRSQQLASATAEFLTGHRHSKLQILVADVDNIKKHPQPLLLLAQRLSSHCEVRTVPTQIDFRPNDLVLADNVGILQQNEHNKASGTMCLHMPQPTAQLGDQFDQAWEQSSPVEEFRRLNI